MMKKYIIMCMFLLLATPLTVTYADKKNPGTGIDPVFEMTGVVKPTEWSDWSQEVKHTFLRDNGIFPQGGKKYSGTFDEKKYLQFIAAVVPTDWDSKSTEEKKQYITESKNIPAEKEKEVKVKNMLQEKEVSIDTYVIFGFLILLAFGFISRKW